jgi:hypothetical protein
MDIVENYHIEITKTEFEDIVELYKRSVKPIHQLCCGWDVSESFLPEDGNFYNMLNGIV